MHVIHRVYESLISQTILDFEWIVIDDGSEDNTESLINEWKKDAPFPIHYYKKNNGGKISAIIFGLKKAKYDWFLIADSDDRFENNTIEIFLTSYNEISKEKKNLISGVSCLCKDSITKEIVGNKYPSSPMISDSIEISYKYNVYGEKWGILKTSVMKEFFFENFPNEVKFITEDYFWFQIAKKYKTIFINEPLRTYYRGTSDSLSSPFTTERHPRGIYLSEEMILKTTQHYHHLKPLVVFKSLLRLSYAASKARISLRSALEKKENSLKLLIFITWPLGKLLKRVRELQYKRNS